MNTRQFAFAVLIEIASFAVFASAQGPSRKPAQTANDNSIYIGSVRFSLGDPQQAVIAKLAEQYTLQKDSGGAWMVYPKVVPPYIAVASVYFKNEKLASFAKYWGPHDQQKGVEFARALYSAVAEMEKDQGRECLVSIGAPVQDPGYEQKAIFITCGPRSRYIRIDIGRDEKFGEDATITEVLDDRRR